MKTKQSIIHRICILLLFILSNFGCGGGSGAGNPLIEIEYDAYNALVWQTPTPAQPRIVAFMQNILQWIVPEYFPHPAQATVSSAVFCFKRVRFKFPSGSSGGNLDFEIGSVTLNPAGASLGDVRVPTGTYERVEFDLSDDCGTNSSVDLVVDAVTYSTDDSISIRFDGDFTVNDDSQVLQLGLQAIINQLDTVTNDNEIKTKAEAASGDVLSLN